MARLTRPAGCVLQALGTLLLMAGAIWLLSGMRGGGGGAAVGGVLVLAAGGGLLWWGRQSVMPRE